VISFGSTKHRALLQPYSDTFGRVDGAFIARVFVAAARSFQRDLLSLVDDLGAGVIDLHGFTARSTRRVREVYLLVYSLGAQSINPFHTVTHRDVRIIDREIEGEGAFLKQFGRDITRHHVDLDPVVRAGLYIRALRGVFELGRLEALPGPYEWELGDTDHCVPCLEASVGGPYQREKASGLGYPPLPGIPGSGSVCDGLTRCGCTLKLAGGITLNMDLQDEIRDILASIVGES